MLRRSFTLGVAGLALAPATPAAAPTVDPLLRVAERGPASVYIMGFAQARDRSWLTPKIARAADESRELWVEVAPFDPAAPPSPVIAERGYDRGRDLFEVLPPTLAERLLALAPKIGLTRERLAPMRPWLARQAVQRAFAASRPTPGSSSQASDADYPERVMTARFRARGAPVKAEFPTLDDLLHHFAGYPLQAQVEDLANLLDYIDDDGRGANADAFSWLTGESSERFIEKMRRETPALYAVSHPQRNRWWAAKIDELLGQEGVAFVLLGNNHVLGPDSVPITLAQRGIEARTV
jgi:uncharacterized protein YbaP (TraB family)